MKKGIAIKYTPSKDQDPVYTSIIKEFDSQEDFENFKDNLNPKKKIIGVIDIKEDIKEQKVIFESNDVKDNLVPKMLAKSLQNDYPFITKIKLEKVKGYHTLLSLYIYFDINKFRKFNGLPPINKNHKDFYKSNSYSGLYRYLREIPGGANEKWEEMWGSEFTHSLEEKLNNMYKKLNTNMIHTKYDDFIFRDDSSFNLFKKWKEDKEPRNISFSSFIPEF